MRAPLLPLLLLLTSLTGVCVASLPLEIYVKAGEMVVLECPQQAGSHHDRCPVMWTSENKLQMDRSSMSPAERRETGLLCLGRSLFILTASVNHEGNYSCSQRNVSGQSWFRLTVYTTLSRELKDRIPYLQECYTQESCLLNCPENNIPNPNNPNFTAYDIIWRKEGESTQEVDGSFSSVVDTDHGVYTCTRPYLYDGQIYNMSFTVVLDIRPSQPNVDKHTVISSPQPNTTFFVDVGSPFVTGCEAVFYSDFTPLFWLSGNTFVEMNDSFPVFSNYTQKNVTEGVKKTVYLVFKEATEENLLTNYTCKMESILGNSSFVTITLAKRVRPSHISVALCPLVIVAVMAATVIVYVKFKIEITLFLRDTMGCHRRTSDGKIYDVFLMCYKSDRVTGLNPCDTRWLVNVLEENLGYKLCLYDRDVQPGKALPEALLDCIEQSQSVVLVPSPVAQSLESGLLSAIHAALVERKTSLVIIKPESAEEAKWGSLPEAFQLLDKTGHCVTWQGLNALPPSASFWKKLRYHLPAVCTGTKAFPLDARLC
ncbi:interleukin-1 receptor-like 1 isoform X1 [Phyllopteryx taeniolatus]|uniref:interleukin-1 receptor-like 1 isoform X1 n=1 Tax=Phyllopteryx taeniolatus TaxID=161469 RepID=UPI002AD4A859|nr:interleukin-1 receptor-like 1 isoform X1 [Phyllopteryx taeniolatus]